MSTLLQKIKADSLQARQDKASNAAFLITLLSEASRPGLDDGKRESTDEEVIHVVKKFSEGAKDLLAAAQSVADVSKINACQDELVWLEKYTPSQLSAEQLEAIIEGYKSEGARDLGSIMGKLRASFAGQYDGSLASKIARDVLTH